jgi:Transposase IS4
MHLNGHLRCDLVELAHGLGAASSAVFSPGNILVVDESLYEFTGKCPIRRYIPRKPHPNGLLVYCLAGQVNVGAKRLPYVLDFEPYLLGNQIGPQEAMIRLHDRLRARHPEITPHLVVDSAFGSFERLLDIKQAGGEATMSMSSVHKPWLWEMLDWGCGIDEGRTAYAPNTGIVVSSFKVETEKRTTHQIKTISSGCEVALPDEQEAFVLRVTDRRKSPAAGNQFEYLAHFADGTSGWLHSQQFIDDDGTINISWLTFVDEDDLNIAFNSYTAEKLKVSPFHFLCVACCHHNFMMFMAHRQCALRKAGNSLVSSHVS